jgi:hypothetical protein
MSKALAEDWREEAVGTGGEEPLRRIDEPQEPAIAVIFGGSYDAMLSQGLWRPIVRSRMGGPPKPPSEAASHGFPSRHVSMRERVKARVWKLGIEVERESEESAN